MKRAKIISVFLSMALLFGTVSMPVMAEEPESITETLEETKESEAVSETAEETEESETIEETIKETEESETVEETEEVEEIELRAALGSCNES